jgi:hypothetical protein
MSVTDTRPQGSLPYEAPTLTRIPVGATAQGTLPNADLLNGLDNTAFPPGGGGGAES